MAGVIPFAGPENDVHVIEFPWVGHIRQIFVGAIEINVVVVIAVEEIADFEGTAQADEMTNRVCMPESDVSGVIGAETRAANADAMSAAFAPREIEYIAHDHIFISELDAHAIGRMNAFVVETVEVNGVGAINGDAVVIDEPGDG